MTKEMAVMLARYSRWADEVLFEAMRTLPENAINQQGSTLFGSMLGTLNHNHVVDLIWRAHLLREPHGFSTRRDILYPDFDVLIQAQAQLDAWYIDWSKQQTASSLAERLEFTFISGDRAKMSRGEMLLHIVNHKTYHRGWVCQMFFDFGQSPPQTDLSVFLCEH